MERLYTLLNRSQELTDSTGTVGAKILSPNRTIAVEAAAVVGTEQDKYKDEDARCIVLHSGCCFFLCIFKCVCVLFSFTHLFIHSSMDVFNRPSIHTGAIQSKIIGEFSRILYNGFLLISALKYKRI